MVMMVLTGCTTVKYNGGETFVKKVDYPEIGIEVTVYVGDYMVQKGTMVEESVLVVHEFINGGYYDIPAKEYKQVGHDSYYSYFVDDGVVRGGLADSSEALAIKKGQDKKVSVVSVYGSIYSYPGKFDIQKRLSEQGDSFQQTLIYSGRIGDKINVGYRELSNNYARPAFNNDVEYDLSASNIIGYKGCRIEVIKADNSSITYKLVQNFR
jgi:hypothetical protein